MINKLVGAISSSIYMFFYRLEKIRNILKISFVGKKGFRFRDWEICCRDSIER